MHLAEIPINFSKVGLGGGFSRWTPDRKDINPSEAGVSPQWATFCLEKAAQGAHHAAQSCKGSCTRSDSMSHSPPFWQWPPAQAREGESGRIFPEQWKHPAICDSVRRSPCASNCVLSFFSPYHWLISAYFPLFYWQWQFPSMSLRECKENGMIPVKSWDKISTWSLLSGQWR